MRKVGTGYSIGRWAEVESAPRSKVSSETQVQSRKDSFLVQGNAASGGFSQGIMVSVAPSAVSKKLAIRRLNSEVEGWTPKSNTVIGKLR